MRKNKILVTAGGTIEPIDSVRSITNISSGILGKLISDEFAKGENNDVFHLASKKVVLPEMKKNIKIISSISDAESLRTEIRKVCKENKIDIIIHSAAVSDYRVKKILYDGREIKVKDKKISSAFKNPVIVLEKTPKIIKELRELSPDAIIIGFKLLTDASIEELKKAAVGLLEKNVLNFVLANDSKNLSLSKHRGYLFSRNGNYTEFTGKDKIARGIVEISLAALDGYCIKSRVLMKN
jgi:phosphopantothenate-cysteine ligase